MKQYLELLNDVVTNGLTKGDRTGTGTKAVFARQYRHNLADGFPLLTTKKLHFKSIANELIWMLSGNTNIKWLNENGVRIWDEWATEDGDLGPVYGEQWTAWPTKDGGTINQIDYMVETLKTNPNSRRILFHGWNVEYLPDETKSPQENARNGKQALPPCHLLYQAFVHDGHLSMQLYIRSSDVFLVQHRRAGAADPHAGPAVRPDPPRDHRHHRRHPRLQQPHGTDPDPTGAHAEEAAGIGDQA